MGIHMPCKAVIIAGDSYHLSTTAFHQMAGRSGRRGFDVNGTIIFMAVPKIRIAGLLSSPIPILSGRILMCYS